jgi:integrase
MKRSQKTRLTELGIAKLKPPADGRIERWDTAVEGFGYRLTSTGAGCFVVALRRPGARHPARYKLTGRTLKEARKEADAALADPAAFFTAREPAKAEDRPDRTFGTLAKQFLAHSRTKRGRELRPATVKEYRRALIAYAAGLHDRAVTNVRRADAADLIRATAKRGAITAMRTRAAGSRFYSWLIANGLCEHNPFTGTEGYDTPKRKRVLTDVELRTIWQATGGAGDFNLIVRLCLWTGCRRGEPGAMADSEIEHVKTKRFDGLVWKVPGTRTKNHRDLWLPVPRQARDALEAWPRIVGRDKLFGRVRSDPDKRDTGFQAWSQSKARLDARIARINAERRLGGKLGDEGQPAKEDALAEWDLHDIRRTVETRMAGLGIRKDIVNRILNHAQGPITETYDQHDYLAEKLRALQAWADALERIVTGESAKVVVLRAAG